MPGLSRENIWLKEDRNGFIDKVLPLDDDDMIPDKSAILFGR